MGAGQREPLRRRSRAWWATWALLTAALCGASLEAPRALAASSSNAHDDCAVSRRFLDLVTSHSLMPWIAAKRNFTLEQATAHFRSLNGSWVAAPVLVHKGELYLLFPLHPSVQYIGMLRVFLDLRMAAELHPELSFELIIGLHDDGQSLNMHGERLPVWSFNRNALGFDVLIPHHYVRPDQLCHEQPGGPHGAVNMTIIRTPFEQRERRLVGRFTHYCAGTREVYIHSNLVEECPRTYFSHLAQEEKEVAGVQLDVAPTNQVNQDATVGWEWRRPNGSFVDARPHIPLAEFAKAKYVLVTDGQVSAGKLANALALGSVVLRPMSRWEQYFEPALQEYVHFVPVWTDDKDDILAKLEWLEREPELAQRIADEGRRFACHHLTQHARTCFWREAVRRYNALMLYRVTDELVEARKREFPMVRVTPDLIRCNLPLGVPFAGICQYETEPPGWEHSRPQPATAAGNQSQFV